MTSIYPDDPEGPETLEEALDALVASLRDLWAVSGAETFLGRLVARLDDGLVAWADWWKPMDLSGHWTKGWTPEETVAAMIRRLLIDPWAEVFRRAYLGNQTAPTLTGIRGMTPSFVIRDEVAQFETNRIAYPLPDMPEGMTLDEWIEAHRPLDAMSRAFQHPTTGEWMTDDEEDPWVYREPVDLAPLIDHAMDPTFGKSDLSIPDEEEGDPCP